MGLGLGHSQILFGMVIWAMRPSQLACGVLLGEGPYLQRWAMGHGLLGNKMSGEDVIEGPSCGLGE